MTLYEFNILNFDEKIAKVWSKGGFIENRLKNVGCLDYLSLYAIDKFYVELIYNPKTNKITDVRSFKTGKRLNKYLPEINSKL